MTTPAKPAQAQQPQQPAPQDGDGLDQAALAVAVAALLAGGSAAGGIVTGTAVSITAAQAVQGLRRRFLLAPAEAQALSVVLGQVMAQPPQVTGIIGDASAQVARMNTARRAQYVIAAAKRVLGAARQARAANQPVLAAITSQLERERRFYAQHQAAMWNRAWAAGEVDMAAAVYGPLLGWLAVNDVKTSAECRAAHGHNFYALAMPDIGFPGMVHPHCRCLPVQPWPGGRLLAGSTTRFARAA